MKINTNPIENYKANYLNNSSLSTNRQNPGLNEVTTEEKKFFANLYPEKSSEIMNYEFYNMKGKVSGVTLGSLIDRRG